MNDLVITPSDMPLFSAVSHDVNPLHTDSDYARRTPFGEPVVFGILGAIGALQHVPDRPGQALRTVSLLFLNPLFVGVPYRVSVTSDEAGDKIEIFDGKRRLMQCAFTYQQAAEPIATPAAVEPTCSRTIPAEWEEADLTAGLRITGIFPPPDSLEPFMARWQLQKKGVSRSQIAALAWTSYLVGMEIPGKQAAYARLDMKLAPDIVNATLPYAYEVALTSRDARFNLLQLQADLRMGDTLVAHAQISAFLREASPLCKWEALTAWLSPSQRLQGKVALVIGGSRGLGSALVLALASQGCTVLLNYARSRSEAEDIRNSLPPMAGAVHLVEGDATDAEWCARQSADLLQEYGGLDFLICNASPAIRPMDFTPDMVERLHRFIDQSLRLVTVPLANFMEPLKLRSGRPIVISSIYTRTAPADFPHYVAAKSAIEGLCRALFTRDHPLHGMLIRPPKLLTDQTNTPLGRREAVMPEQVAAGVVALLLEPATQGELQIVEEFDIHV